MMMPIFSVVTPLHAPGNAFVLETYRSLQSQSFSSWEWRILPNRGGIVPKECLDDPRVSTVAMSGSGSAGIGALKRYLSLTSKGEYIVELDADDLLAPDALLRAKEAFDRGADFVYSDFSEFESETWKASFDGYPYGSAYGWENYPVEHEGHPLLAMKAPPATAHNLRLIDWSPNHLRAWSAKSYREVGGHKEDMKVGDDHDLMVRYYLAGKRFEHVPECLYFYRVHPLNTVKTMNSDIRSATGEVFNRFIYALGEEWTRRMGLKFVDLCGAHDAPPGYLILDQEPCEGGMVCDLDGRWPIADDSVGLLRASDAVEHLKDPVHTMNEAYRVLAPGGFMIIDVPSTNGLGAFCDPTHVSYWNKLSFRYYAEERFARYIPAFKGRFQAARVIEHFPSDWHREENVPYAQAHLFALKDGFCPMGLVGW